MIGKHSYSLSDTDYVTIGKFCSIAGGVVFHSDDNHACIREPKLVSTYPFKSRWNMELYPDSSGKGMVKIENDVWIGEGVRILSGVHIGNGVVIGAGAVVTKDIPDYAIVAGNPARIKKYRFRPNQIKALLKIKWWEWEDSEIRNNLELMLDIRQFIKQNI